MTPSHDQGLLMATKTVSIDYDPYSAAMHADPFSTYARLRAEAPLYRNEERGFWALSRYDDVSAASRDWQTFSYAHGNDIDHTGEVFGPGNFLDADPPRHTVLRNVVRKAFVPKDLTSRMLAPVTARTDELLDRLLEQRTLDFADDFAWALPLSSACALLGIASEDEAALRPLASASSVREVDVTVVPLPAREAFGAIEQHLAELIAARRGVPVLDLLGEIANATIDDEPLSDEVATGIALVLFVASIETTASLLANAVRLLAEHPDQRAALARDPAMIPAAIEEVLRFQSPLQVFSRMTTREVEMHGQLVPAASRVFVIYGSANRDERRFENPEVFDVARPPKRHLAFGDGIHHCLGAPLARLEARVALEALLSRAPEYELAGPGERLCNHGIRGWVSLPIALN